MNKQVTRGLTLAVGLLGVVAVVYLAAWGVNYGIGIMDEQKYTT